MSAPSHYRYPGALSFQDDDVDRKIFQGRDGEKEDLLHLVLAEELVVVFAKSGMGKTSLLNAGLMEPLRQEGYLPISVRLNDPAAGPFRTLYDGIAETASRQGIEHVPGEETSLWHFFKTLELWRDDHLLTPVLILDQFEELFTLQSRESRNAFIGQLADLVRGKAPRDLADVSPSSPLVKVVLSIREDFLGNLEELGRKIPHILNIRFRLGPLSRYEAGRAIREPARVHDEQIGTPRFEYEQAAVEAILDFLGKRRLQEAFDTASEVEPFQLQLICQHAESIVRTRQEAAGPVAAIRYVDLGGDAGIYRMLKRFYDSQIEALAGTYGKRRLYKLCEEGLISTQGRRLSLEEKEIERRFHVPREALQRLVNQRLLRGEPRLGSTYYELSHDTLVEPVLASRHRRQRSQRLAAAGAALATILIATGALGWRGYVDSQENALTKDALQIRSLLANDPRQALVLAIDATGRSLALHGRLTPEVSMGLAEVVEQARFSRLQALQEIHPTVSALAPGGEVVAAGTKDGRIILYDTLGNRLRNLTTTAGGPVTKVVYSPGGRWVAAVIGKDRLRLWSREGGPAGGPYVIDGGVRDLAFGLNDDCLAVATPNGLRLLEVATRQWSGEKPQAGVTRLTSSPDGKRLLSLLQDGTARLWDILSPLVLADPGGVLAVMDSGNRWSFGGNRQAVVRGGGIWIGARGPQQRLRPLPDNGKKGALSLALSSDGNSIAIGRFSGGFELHSIEPDQAEPKAEEAAGGVTFDGAAPEAGQKRVFFDYMPTSLIALGKSHAVTSDYTGRRITIWGLEIENRRRFYTGEEKVAALAIDSTGSRAILGNADCSVTIWSFAGERLRSLRRDIKGCSIRSLAIDPEAKFFAVSDSAGHLETWDFAGHRLASSSEGPPVVTMIIDPDGKLISRHSDGSIREWSTSQGRALSFLRQVTPPLRVTAATFAPDGAIVFGADDGRWWKFPQESYTKKTGDRIELDATAEKGAIESQETHAGAIQALAFSPDGASLVSGDAKGGLRMWSANSEPLGRLVGGSGSPVASAGFLSSGQGMVALTQDHTLTAWDRYGMSPPDVREVQTGAGHGLVVDPKGAFFVTISTSKAGKEMALWDLRTARKLNWTEKIGECSPTGIAIRPDGLGMAVGCENGRIAMADSWLGELPGASAWLGDDLPGASKKPGAAVRALAFDLQGRYFAAGDDKGKVGLWSARGELLAIPWPAHQGPVLALAVSPDGNWIASASGVIPTDDAESTGEDDSNVKLWNRWERGEVKELPGHPHRGVNSLAFSPDGKTLITGGDDGTVRFWDVEEAKKAADPLEVGGRVSSVAFSPDGTGILIAGFDGYLQFWDRNQLTPAFPTRGKSEPWEVEEQAVQAAFAPGGDLLISSAAQGTTLLQRAGWRVWLRVACDRLRRDDSWLHPKEERERSARETCERWAWPEAGLSGMYATADLDEGVSSIAAQNPKPLHRAVLMEDTRYLTDLLHQGKDPNARDEAGRTPLVVAAMVGREEAARVLLARRADPRTGDVFGDTPLHHAAARGDKVMIELLLRGGAAPGVDNRYGVTPLMKAAYRGQLAVVRMLLDRGVSADAADDVGNTALMDAARGGHLDVVELLLARQADIDRENSTSARRTALSWAKSEGHTEVADFLRERKPRITEDLPDFEYRSPLKRYAPAHLRPAAETMERYQAPTQDEAAVRAFRTVYPLAERGDSFAQILVGNAYARGLGVAYDPDRAMGWYRRSAEQGDPLGQAVLGMAYWMAEGRHTRQDVQQALIWNQRSAEQGHPEGQLHLGAMYRLGIGVEKSGETSFCYYLTAARERLPDFSCDVPVPSSAQWTGDPAALNSVGRNLELGLGHEADGKAAFDYYLRAANLGDSIAQRNAGTQLFYGRAVRRSYPQAHEWLRRAADQGDTYALGILGDTYLYGYGVPQSNLDAMSWYSRGAEAGEPWVQVRMGWMLERGVGGKRSLIEAVGWYRKAAAQGEFQAIQKLESLGMMP